MNKIYITSLSFLVIFLLLTPPVNAAKPSAGGGGTTTQLGIDVSYPQCGKTLPSSFAFAVVGINGGNAANTNPCLANQLIWANKASGNILSQPKIQLYVNTANPGEVINIAKAWPTSNSDRTGFVPNNPYGDSCSGGNDLACSWQYGWDRALEAVVDRFIPAAIVAKIDTLPSKYIWWLDVETMNTWQSGSADALKRNVASLEGIKSYYQSLNAEVGIYSTAVQWKEITGNYINIQSNLNGLKNWRPGGASLNTAKQACTATPLTANGKVVMTQFISKNLDYNYSCI
jgi:hypothetical protein